MSIKYSESKSYSFKINNINDCENQDDLDLIDKFKGRCWEILKTGYGDLFRTEIISKNAEILGNAILKFSIRKINKICSKINLTNQNPIYIDIQEDLLNANGIKKILKNIEDELISSPDIKNKLKNISSLDSVELKNIFQEIENDLIVFKKFSITSLDDIFQNRLASGIKFIFNINGYACEKVTNGGRLQLQFNLNLPPI